MKHNRNDCLHREQELGSKRAENCELRAENKKNNLKLINKNLKKTTPLSVLNRQVQNAGHRSQVAGHRSQVTGQ